MGNRRTKKGQDDPALRAYEAECPLAKWIARNPILRGQRQAAANLRRSKSAVNLWLRGHTKPREDDYPLIAEMMGSELADIVGEDGLALAWYKWWLAAPAQVLWEREDRQVRNRKSKLREKRRKKP